MALIRNIAGVHKLGANVESSPDMAKMLPDSDGGGGGWLYPDGGYDYQPVYDLRPPDEFEPDGADVVDVDVIHPVYPIEPIYGYEEEPAPVEVPQNTVQVTPQGKRVVDITAVGALAAVLFMAIGPRPKGLLGGLAYGGALGLLWLQLHYQTPAPVSDPAVNE
jgi:hypothetical protein